MEPSDNEKKLKVRKTKESEEITDSSFQIRSLSSYDLSNFINNLSHPKFLGSIHLRKEAMPPYNRTLETMVNGELGLKMNKSLKSSFLNPITLALIFIAIVFNLFWIIFMYL